MIYKIFLILTFLSSCMSPSEVANKADVIEAMANSISKKYPQVHHLTIRELNSMPPNKVLLVDVRSNKERQISTIERALSQEQFKQLTENEMKAKHIVFYCTIGQRSSQLISKMLKNGFKGKISNLKGSILAWTQKSLPLVDSKNAPTNKIHVYSEAWNLVPKMYEPIWN